MEFKEIVTWALKDFVKYKRRRILTEEIINNISSLLKSYSLQDQHLTIAEEIGKYLANLNDDSCPEKIELDIKNKFKIADGLELDEIEYLSRRIIIDNLIKYSSSAWEQYFYFVKETEWNKFKGNLKSYADKNNEKLDQLLQIVRGRVYSLDSFEAELSTTWSDERVHIDLSFFNYDDQEFKDNFRNLIFRKKDDVKYIYVEGINWEESLYVTLYELSTMPIRKDVVVVKDKASGSHLDFIDNDNMICVLAYDACAESIPDGFVSGTLIIPKSKTSQTGNRNNEIVSLMPRSEHNMLSALYNAGVENCSDFIDKHGHTFTSLKKSLSRGEVGDSFIYSLPILEIEILKKLVLLTAFENKDFSLISEYLGIREGELYSFLKKYSGWGKKLFEIEREPRSHWQAIKSLSIVPNDNNYKELFRMAIIDKDYVKAFFDFSIDIMRKEYHKVSNSLFAEIDGSDTLIQGILSTWIRLKQNGDYESEQMCHSFVENVIHFPRLQRPYYIKLLARIDYVCAYDVFYNQIKELPVASTQDFRSLWFRWNEALELGIDYFDKNKLFLLWHDAMPIFEKFGCQQLLIDFAVKELSPWQESVLFNTKEIVDFLNEYKNNNNVFALSLEFFSGNNIFPIYKSISGIEHENLESLFNTINNEERRRLVGAYIRCIVENCIDSHRLIKVLNSHVLDYDLSVFDDVFRYFDEFTDDQKVEIELILRKKVKSIVKQTELKEKIEIFISSIMYQKKFYQYVWLFSYSLGDMPPYVKDYSASNIYETKNRIEEIKKNLDDDFNSDILIDILSLEIAKDIEGIIGIYLQYTDSEYSKDFLYALVDRSPCSYPYIEAIVEKNTKIIPVILSDLLKKSDARFFGDGLASILSFIPYNEAKTYIENLHDDKFKEYYYRLLRIKWIDECLLEQHEEKEAINMMQKDGFHSVAIQCLKDNPKRFDIVDMIDILVCAMRANAEQTKHSLDYFDNENNIISLIRKYAYSKPELYETVMQLESWFLSPKYVFTETSINTLYMNMHPEYFIKLLENDVGESECHIYDLLNNKRCLIIKDYLDWINNVESLIKNKNIEWLAYHFIAYWLCHAPKEDGFEYVPIEEIAYAIEHISDEIRSQMCLAIFNEGNCHVGDGGVFLDKVANNLKSEASAIQERYPKLSSVLYCVASDYHNYAVHERQSDRYE